MAKGNPFWGKQKGKLGETVLAVVKGQQVQRAYNAEPLNPRSNKQTAQRIVFSSAVKLFKSAIAQQFKFAFEDKRQQESDYNAFMRHNAKNGMIITRDQFVNKNFPSVGEFLLSVGSLEEVKTRNPQGADDAEFVYDKTYDTEATSLQEVATRLKNTFSLLDGDIITLVYIKSGAENLNTKPANAPSWNVVQIKVGDSTDARTVASVRSSVNVYDHEEYLSIEMSGSKAEGCAIIISRPTPSGLQVSTSRIWFNETALDILTASQDPAYIKQAKNSWGMGTSAVLEGSLLPNV